MKVLGVIGGLGPQATAHFLNLMTIMNQVDVEQNHINQYILSYPATPDRTAYVLDHTKENPYATLLSLGRKLETFEVDYITIPCFSAHYFYDKLQEDLSVPMIHPITLMVEHLKRNAIKKVGILCTEGSKEAGIFNTIFNSYQIETIYPTIENQRKVSGWIYKVIKLGEAISKEEFASVSKELVDFGSERIILGCTELSLIDKSIMTSPIYLDGLECLAANTISLFKGNVKQEYQYLVNEKGND